MLPRVQFEGAPLEPQVRINDVGPALLEGERRMYYGQMEIVREYARLNGLNRIAVNPPKARFGIFTGGKTYYDVRQALMNLGLDDAALEAMGIRILTMGLLYPVEPTIVEEFAQGLEEIIVVEDKRPLLELFIKDLLYARPDRPVVVGKADEKGAQLLTAHGELQADQIAAALERRLARFGLQPRARTALPMAAPKSIAPVQALPGRLPYFCSGCPHNRSLQVPEGSVVGAGIGCHAMTLWMGPVFGEVAGYTQMGGEGAQWVGLAPFTTNRHFFQNLGDGTFHHSGSLAVRFAIASGANITYKILYNRAVAMTGGQDVAGAMGVPELVKMLYAEGAKRIIVTTDEPEKYQGRKAATAEVWHRDRLVEAEELLAATPGVTVLINDQQCAAEKRRLRKRGKLAYKPKAVFINERVCEGCGDCGRKSNCLSVQPVDTEFGRKTQIHQSSCNQDFSCLSGDCPSFLTVETADGGPPKAIKRKPVALPRRRRAARACFHRARAPLLGRVGRHRRHRRGDGQPDSRHGGVHGRQAGSDLRPHRLQPEGGPGGVAPQDIRGRRRAVAYGFERRRRSLPRLRFAGRRESRQSGDGIARSHDRGGLHDQGANGRDGLQRGAHLSGPGPADATHRSGDAGRTQRVPRCPDDR